MPNANLMFKNRFAREAKKPPEVRLSEADIRIAVEVDLAKLAEKDRINQERAAAALRSAAAGWLDDLSRCQTLDEAIDCSWSFYRAPCRASCGHGLNLARLREQLMEINGARNARDGEEDFVAELVEAGVFPGSPDSAYAFIQARFLARLKEPGLEAWAYAVETGDYQAIARQ